MEIIVGILFCVGVIVVMDMEKKNIIKVLQEGHTQLEDKVKRLSRNLDVYQEKLTEVTHASLDGTDLTHITITLNKENIIKDFFTDSKDKRKTSKLPEFMSKIEVGIYENNVIGSLLMFQLGFMPTNFIKRRVVDNLELTISQGLHLNVPWSGLTRDPIIEFPLSLIHRYMKTVSHDHTHDIIGNSHVLQLPNFLLEVVEKYGFKFIPQSKDWYHHNDEIIEAFGAKWGQIGEPGLVLHPYYIFESKYAKIELKTSHFNSDYHSFNYDDRLDDPISPGGWFQGTDNEREQLKRREKLEVTARDMIRKLRYEDKYN